MNAGPSRGKEPTPRLERHPPDNHWLTRPGTIRVLWGLFGAVLAVTVLAQFFVDVEGKFSLDGTFGFGAWFGFSACVGLVLLARAVGWFLKRPEDYYGSGEPRANPREQSDD